MATFELIAPSAEILAIHAALLPTGIKGKVIILGGDEHNDAQAGRDDHLANPADVDNTRIYDVNAKTITGATSPITDVFCSGHAFLGDGRLVIGGGTESWEGGGGPGGGHVHGLGNFGGHQACWVFNYLRNAWERIADFNFDTSFGKTGGGRWYPTLLTLPNGDLIAFSGHPSRRSDHWHNNNIPERYSQASGRWSWIKPTASEITFYPRIHLIKGGLLFICAVEDGTSRFYNPVTGDFEGSSTSSPGGIYDGWDNTSVLLPLLPNENYKARILMSDDINPKKIDLEAATLTWQNAGTRTGAAAGRLRKWGISTILPDGKIVVFGGVDASNSDSTKVLEPEIYDPGINWITGTYSNPESWQSQPADPNGIARNYHSTNLLLPDGSLFTAGSSHNAASGDPATTGEMRIVIFKPDYFDNPARPDLNSTEFSTTYGKQIQIDTPNANTIQRVALIRNGSSTHAFNPDQRYVGLNFDTVNANTLIATIPTDPSVLPPGYYMLWIINNAGLPCRLAKFIRVAFQSCEIITDRSTFSVKEVDAQPVGNAIFQNAFYVVYDGFLPSELNNFSTAPNISFTKVSDGSPIPDMQAIHADTLFENPALPADIPQKVTFVFNVKFTSNTAFGFTDVSEDVRITAILQQNNCAAVINLIKEGNPYMVDGPASWLSVDVRVFQMREGGPSRATISQGASGTGFISALLSRFNDRNIYPGDDLHPFNDIFIDQQTSQLEWLETSGGVRVFNYAVAKVRYKAPVPTLPPLDANDASNVKVFFRLFNTAGTAMQYNTATTYKIEGVDAIATVGKEGGLISSIPFFAEPRVNYSTALMASQPDTHNKKPITAKGNTESVVYFGCWLDFNQPGQQIPVTEDATHGTSFVNLQTSIRGIHQCLVAEVFFNGDPTPMNATPSSSDNLSQRNLAIAHSDNPGSPATHTAQHTFEIKPSLFHLPKKTNGESINPSMLSTNSFAATDQITGPDILMIHWNNLPRESKVTLYMPDIDVEDILALEPWARLSSTKITKEDEHSFSFTSADVNYIPIPGGIDKNIPGLITVELPSNVVKGQLFKVLVQQARYYRNARRIIGSFQFNIAVGTAETILKKEMRNLSILQYVRQSMSVTDPWRLIFNKYIKSLSDKINGLGGDASAVPASSDDRWLYNDGQETLTKGFLALLIGRCCKRVSVFMIVLLLLLLLIAILILLK